MKRLSIILLLSAAVSVCACEAISNFIHDDDVVAKAGTHKLYRSQVEDFIPDGLSEEDSTSLALQYIGNWAKEQLFIDMATQQLSKAEKDVSAELEDYRNSLLKYRYEQRYINERLDTVIARSDIEKYYEEHQDLFILDAPVLKARFLDIMSDSPNLDVIRKKMSSSDYEDLMEADSLAYSSALKYLDYSETWVSATSLAREFGTDYRTMLSNMKGSFIEMKDEGGEDKIAYVCDICRQGSVAPIEYCSERIRDIILSGRKHSLLVTLEQDLLKDALENEKYVIY